MSTDSVTNDKVTTDKVTTDSVSNDSLTRGARKRRRTNEPTTKSDTPEHSRESHASGSNDRARGPGRPDGLNSVQLSGRVSGVDDERALPSGDVLRTFRLVVPRPERARGQVKTKTTVDTIDCVCWSGSTRRAVARLQTGDQVEVHGALRRRFFRLGGAVASRYEVEVSTVRRARAAAQTPP
ncbi:MAG: single-stranded DNA-binding protein [Tetrasphaera sp.]